jgi:hypothetical protein
VSFHPGPPTIAGRQPFPAIWPGPRRLALLVALLLAIAGGGCAGYRLGNCPVYSKHIRTVHVPMFESDSYRRNLGEWLTEAVVKELELQSPYKVVHTPDADSVLYGRITSDQKQTLAEERNDNPRDIGIDLVINVRWVERSGETVLRSASIPIDVTVLGGAHFVPEGGQSMSTAQQRAIRQLARQIVGQMEAAW